MPRVRRRNLPRAVLDHLIARIHEREISTDQLTLLARWLDTEPEAGRYLYLGTGTLSTLGTDHDIPVITSWNVPHGPAS